MKVFYSNALSLHNKIILIQVKMGIKQNFTKDIIHYKDYIKTNIT